jgi:hypothetical protein
MGSSDFLDLTAYQELAGLGKKSAGRSLERKPASARIDGASMKTPSLFLVLSGQ